MVETDKKWAIACYVPVLNVIACPLAVVRRVSSSLCRFHARQGLVLFGLWFFTIIVALFSQVFGLVLWCVVLILHGAGMAFAFTEKEVRIPFIGQIADAIPEYFIFEILTGKHPEKEQSGVAPAANSAPVTSVQPEKKE